MNAAECNAAPCNTQLPMPPERSLLIALNVASAIHDIYIKVDFFFDYILNSRTQKIIYFV